MTSASTVPSDRAPSDRAPSDRAPSAQGEHSPTPDHVRAGFSWRVAGPVVHTERRLPVVLLHGLTGSRAAWEPQLSGLGADRHVLAWDAPGYGGSAPLPTPASFADFADAVIGLADAAGIERFHLVGLSFGGMIAQHVALRHPGRLASLALLSTSPQFGFDGVTTPESWRAARLAPLDAGQVPSDFAPVVMRAISGPNITEDALGGQIRAADLVSARALRTAIDVLITHDTRDHLAHISTPTVCIVGELDGETPPDYAAFLAEWIPDCELTVLAGAGHLVNVEAPDQVNRILLQHFARNDHASGTT